MDGKEIKKRVEREISKASVIENSHGITLENIRNFLVEPYKDSVFGEDPNDPPKDMWIVLHECSDPFDGWRIGLNPETNEWCLVETDSRGRSYSDTWGGKTIIEALKSM
jgi:hypothetical protein